MVSLMVVALTNKISLSVPETKGLQVYMRLTTFASYKEVAVKVIQNLMRYHIYNKANSRFQNVHKARRALKKLLSVTKDLREARRLTDSYQNNKYSQDDLITTIDRLHIELHKLKKIQSQIVVKNESLAQGLDDYAMNTHKLDLSKVRGQRKYYEVNDGVDLVKTAE